MTLDELGPRICILGPSNSGKSTLAAAIERARGVPAIHLDQLSHLPGTDWARRPLEEFVGMHDSALLAQTWIVDGNYLCCLRQRLARATGVILLDVSSPIGLLRYFRRTVLKRDRRGALQGGRDSLKWEMIRDIAVTARMTRRRGVAAFDQIALPKLTLSTSREIDRLYRAEGLRR